MIASYSIQKGKARSRVLVLGEAPEQDGTITIRFKGSRGWRKAHPEAEPFITTAAVAGQTDYGYPKGLKENSITEITVN